MPTTTDTLIDLIERFYALADDPFPDWVGALDALARYAGGTHGQLVAGVLRRPYHFDEISGIDASDCRAMAEEHGGRDPRTPLWHVNVGRVYRDNDIEPPGFNGHPLVRDYLDRLGMRRYVGLALSPDGSKVASVAVLRPDRLDRFDELEATKFGRAARHLLRVQALRESLARAASLGASLEAGLARSLRATVLVDNGGRILFLNSPAEDLLRRGVLACKSGSLSVTDASVADRFEAMLASVCSPGAGAWEEDMVVLLHSEDPNALSGVRRDGAQIFALPPSHPFRTVAPSAVACVRLVHLSGEDAGASTVEPDVLMKAFGLTPREARLAAFVGAGNSLDAACQTFGVSRNTVRVQLQAVFDKTGTRRQAELVRLVQGLASLKA